MAVAIKKVDPKDVKRVDPRVVRTRKLLEQAFIELMDEKGFQEMTIQDISERATVNRATFYAHFEDKYDMLDSFIRQIFNQALADKVPLAPIYTVERLQQIIVTVMEFFAPLHKHCTPTNRQQMTPMLESAVQEELMKYLLAWFSAAPPSLAPKGVKMKTAASVWSWAIFGNAFQWAQEGQKAPAGEIAREITLALTADYRTENP
jgi:AcrR family transcriptional regulator